MSTAGSTSDNTFARTKRFVLSPPGWIVVAALFLGVFLRFHAFGFPKAQLFDEHHFVNNARNYLSARADKNDHPPLGKLLIAQSMAILGDTPVGWRFPSAVAGLGTIVAGAFAAARLFSPEAGVIAVGLLGLDGFLIAYSRAGLLDGFLALAAMLSVVLASLSATLPVAALGGILTGLAMNVKFSGIGVAIPLLFAIVLAPASKSHRARMALLAGLLGVITYFACFSYGLRAAGQPASLMHVVLKTRGLFQHHLDLTDMKNPATSGWVTWVLPVRPLILGYTEHLGTIRAMTSLGNLAIWWPTVALTGAVVAIVAWRGLDRVLNPMAGEESHYLTDFVVRYGRAICIIISSAAAFLMPWVMTHRDSYIYHFLPIYAVLILLLAGFIARLRERRPRYAFAFLCAVLLVGAFYAPLWSFMPMGQRAYDIRLFLKSWR